MHIYIYLYIYLYVYLRIRLVTHIHMYTYIYACSLGEWETERDVRDRERMSQRERDMGGVCERLPTNRLRFCRTGRVPARQPSNTGRVPRQPSNAVGIDMGAKQWNTKELVRMDLRRAGVACGPNDGLRLPCRPSTGGNTFGVPYPYQWVYTHPSRIEDRVAQWPGNLKLQGSDVTTRGNSMGTRRFHRIPWNGDGDGDVPMVSLQTYVEEKRRSALAKDLISIPDSASPRFRLAFKVNCLPWLSITASTHA